MNEYRIKEVLADLDSLAGLSGVKQKIHEWVSQTEEANGTGEPATRHFIFVGNTGTGKTTVARIIAELYKAFGILQEGQLVEAARADLVAGYVGQTAIKTQEVVDKALGGVLFIDDFEDLTSHFFGQEAIDMILKNMEDHRDELVVILSGSADKMKDIIEANPGIKSRFNTVIEFDDYKPEELFRIFEGFCKNDKYVMTPQAIDTLKNHFTDLYNKRDKNFGNCRDVRNLFQSTVIAQAQRLFQTTGTGGSVSEAELNEINENDILACLNKNDMDKQTTAEDLEELNSLVGLPGVKQKIQSLFSQIKIFQNRKELGLPVPEGFSYHLVFTGNSGTDKTNVARVIAQIYKSLGILQECQLVEVDASDIATTYIGQTALKMQGAADKALGGVLLINDAHLMARSVKDGYYVNGDEAVDALIKKMEDHRDDLIVILSGSADGMKDFIEANPGIKSRFNTVIEFDD